MVSDGIDVGRSFGTIPRSQASSSASWPVAASGLCIYQDQRADQKTTPLIARAPTP